MVMRLRRIQSWHRPLHARRNEKMRAVVSDWEKTAAIYQVCCYLVLLVRKKRHDDHWRIGALFWYGHEEVQPAAELYCGGYYITFKKQWTYCGCNRQVLSGSCTTHNNTDRSGRLGVGCVESAFRASNPLDMRMLILFDDGGGGVELFFSWVGVRTLG